MELERRILPPRASASVAPRRHARRKRVRLTEYAMFAFGFPSSGYAGLAAPDASRDYSKAILIVHYKLCRAAFGHLHFALAWPRMTVLHCTEAHFPSLFAKAEG